MARSVHAFVRGNTAQFYEWLSGAEGRALPQGPPIWIAGDCHVGNLGPIGNIEGKINVQIRDLDQTVIGNPAHDLIRLGLSLATAARDSDLSGVVTTQMIEQLMAGYEDCFDGNKEKGGFPRPEMIKVMVKEAASRSWKDLAKERIGKSLDAPYWLWSSIVELVADHEGSYLEHCRKYSQEKAAH